MKQRGGSEFSLHHWVLSKICGNRFTSRTNCYTSPEVCCIKKRSAYTECVYCLLKWVQLIPSVRLAPRVRPLTALTLSSGPSHWKSSQVLQGSFLVFWGPLHAQLPIIYSLIVLQAGVTGENPPKSWMTTISKCLIFCEKLFWVNTCRCESVAETTAALLIIQTVDFVSWFPSVLPRWDSVHSTCSEQGDHLITVNIVLMSPRAVWQRMPFIRAASHKPTGITTSPKDISL